MQNNNNSNAGKFKEEFDRTHTQHFKRLFERTSRIFRLLPRPYSYSHSILETQEEIIFIICGLELGLESSCFNPSQLRPIQELQSYRAFRASNPELQSYRASEPRTQVRKHTKHRKTPFFALFEIL